MASWRFGRLRKLAAMPASRRRDLLVALRLLWRARLGLWAKSFARLRKEFQKLERPQATPRGPRPTPDELAWCIEAASRYVPAATCLVRSLAAQALLRHNGHQSTLRIGVARGPRGALDAHAWVECDGKVVVGEVENLGRYTPLPRLESAAVR